MAPRQPLGDINSNVRTDILTNGLQSPVNNSWCAINKPNPIEQPRPPITWCAINDGWEKSSLKEPTPSPDLPDPVSTHSLKRKATEELHEQPSSIRAVNVPCRKSNTPTPILLKDLSKNARASSIESQGAKEPRKEPSTSQDPATKSQVSKISQKPPKAQRHQLPSKKDNVVNGPADKQAGDMPTVRTGGPKGRPPVDDLSDLEMDDEEVSRGKVAALKGIINSIPTAPGSGKIELDCDQVREKIQLLLDSKVITANKFQKLIGITGTPYYRFMRQSGDEGSKSRVYSNTLAYLNHCKTDGYQGLKPVKSGFVPPKAVEAPIIKAKVEEDEFDELWDVSMVELQGEEDEEVEVYDTCDVIREKIRTILDTSGASQVRFCRELSKSFLDGKIVKPPVLASFLAKSGPTNGNTSRAFYASYVFFEKIRIRDGEPKTEFRETMEDIYDGLQNGGNDRPGLDVKKRPDHTFYVSVEIDKEPFENEYGQIEWL